MDRELKRDLWRIFWGLLLMAVMLGGIGYFAMKVPMLKEGGETNQR